MNSDVSTPGGGCLSSAPEQRLSYKFQRLRERLRTAIVSGELSGRLPGERQLARRFHVNAKTLSKALTDLAAEGLLERNIGRGTFVRGSDRHKPVAERWLIVCDPDQMNYTLIDHIRQANGNVQTVSDISSLRPSALNSIRAAIVLSKNAPDSFLRDLVVRNVLVVLVGREPTTYSVSAVLVDRALGAMCLARDMMLSGHRRFLAVEQRGLTLIADTVRKAAQRYAPDSTVDSAFAADAAAAVENGVTAIICDSRRSAAAVGQYLRERGVSIPGSVSLAAIGAGPGDYPCTGYYVHCQQKAQAVIQLVRDTQIKRPTTLWLTGTYVDHGTIAPSPGWVQPLVSEQPRPMA